MRWLLSLFAASTLAACAIPTPSAVPTTVVVTPEQAQVAIGATVDVDVAVCALQPAGSVDCPESDLMPGRFLDLSATRGFVDGGEAMDLVTGRGSAQWTAPSTAGQVRLEGVTDDGHAGASTVQVVGPLAAATTSVEGLIYEEVRPVAITGWIAPLSVAVQDAAPLSAVFDETTSLLSIELTEPLLSDDLAAVVLEDGGGQVLTLSIGMVATPVIPTSFVLEPDETEVIASPLEWMRVTALAEGVPDGSSLTFFATAGRFLGEDGGALQEGTQTAVTATLYGGQAYALWQAAAEPGTVYFIGQMETAVTAPVSVELVAPPEDGLALTPSSVWMAPGQSLPFTVTGGSNLFWSTLDDDLLTCDGGSFEACQGASSVQVTVDPSWDPDTRPSLGFWVTDVDSGLQAQAVITSAP